MLQALIYNPPSHNGLDILYQDDNLIILNKPPGLLSVPGRGEDKQDCMLSRLHLEYPCALTVHRLDMPTSGIIMFALDKHTQKKLSQLFEGRKIKKQYIACVMGQLKPDSGVIKQPLLTDWPNRPKQKIDYATGKPSTTRYRLISYNNTSSLVHLEPITGRSHQLRVHMSSLGNPILGDELYGTHTSKNASNRLLLHAERLSFTHPIKGNLIDIYCQADFI